MSYVTWSHPGPGAVLVVVERLCVSCSEDEPQCVCEPEVPC